MDTNNKIIENETKNTQTMTVKPSMKSIKYVYPKGVSEEYNNKYIDPLLFDEAHRYIKSAEGIRHLKIINTHGDIIIATDKFAVTIKNVNGDPLYLFYAFGYDFRAESIEDALKVTHFILETDDVIMRNGGVR